MARLLLPGVQRVRPYGQGGLDYLCGLYAAINAINVVLAPHAAFGRSAARHLFEQGIAELDARRLLPDAVSEGMGIEEQYRLTLRLAAATSARVGVPLSVTRPTADAKPFRRHTLLSAVDDALDAGAAVIVCLQGSYAGNWVTVFEKAAYRGGCPSLPELPEGTIRHEERYRHFRAASAGICG